ncbi:hypothetical protein [Cryobacterium breve]|uniref:hypothetical protein n=1 Tax=Cryobacterium breve TaxID=1259258 RepID=UPI00248D0814|nr:hypothetical protein [Cryobacterium breve]
MRARAGEAVEGAESERAEDRAPGEEHGRAAGDQRDEAEGDGDEAAEEHEGRDGPQSTHAPVPGRCVPDDGGLGGAVSGGPLRGDPRDGGAVCGSLGGDRSTGRTRGGHHGLRFDAGVLLGLREQLLLRDDCASARLEVNLLWNLGGLSEDAHGLLQPNRIAFGRDILAPSGPGRHQIGHPEHGGDPHHDSPTQDLATHAPYGMSLGPFRR